MDFTDSKLTEITFHLIVESVPNAVLLVNKEGKIAYVNRQCELLFGYSAPELIGQSVELLMPERFRGQHMALRHRFVEAPSLRATGNGRELLALRKDGSEFPIEIGLNPLVLVDGTWILATAVDVTPHKQAEDRFQKVVQAAPNAIVLVNRQGVIMLVNPQATALFGYSEQELIGQSVDILIPESIRPRHAAHIESFFNNPQTRYMGSGRDLIGVQKDGTQIPIEAGLNPIQIDNQLMVLTTIVDISERRAQEELRMKKEAAEAAYQAKGELLAIASHDLKNPLSAIAGLADIMLQMKKADPNASSQDTEFLQTIYDASRHMSEVVKGILENEGLEQQGFRLNIEKVDVSELCAELIRFNEQAANKKDIQIVAEIAPGIVLDIDRTRLREAFDNYISNAIKYSPPGRVVTVSLSIIPDRQVEFGVRDQGPGLSEDDKKKLFEKFKKLSAKPTAGESSTGLGLSIVKTIIGLHKGTVGCASEHGDGAYFWARLPLTE